VKESVVSAVLILFALFLVAVFCGPLPRIRNGRLSFSNDSRPYETVAYYSCNPGYFLVGEDSRQCLGDGDWTGSAPRCNRQ